MRAAKGPRHGAVAHRWGGKGSRAGLVRPSAEKAARRPHGEESSRRGELTAVLSYSTAYREGWARLFSELQSSRTRDNRHKWQHGKFWRDISIFLIFFFFFIMGEVMHWLLRMFVRSPFLETVKKKIWLDKALSNLCWPSSGWTGWPPDVPSYLYDSAHLWKHFFVLLVNCPI